MGSWSSSLWSTACRLQVAPSHASQHVRVCVFSSVMQQRFIGAATLACARTNAVSSVTDALLTPPLDLPPPPPPSPRAGTTTRPCLLTAIPQPHTAGYTTSIQSEAGRVQTGVCTAFPSSVPLFSHPHRRTGRLSTLRSATLLLLASAADRLLPRKP